VGLLLGTLAGCKATPAASSKAEGKTYPIRGVVQSTEAGGRVVLRGDEVPGYMAPMTMVYRVEDPSALQEMHPGDAIAATLVAPKPGPGATAEEELRLKDVVILAQAQPDYRPAMQYHVPAPGDAVPDFTLLDQSGKTVGLKQYRGKVVLLTFIYTRCPLSDYCPRMSRNFAQIDAALAEDKRLYAATHLLSVSFDPAYDTPKVLKSYGGAYTGRFGEETFQHWEFAAPPAAELPRMEQFFDVGVTPGENGSLQHSLATVVIGRDGRVVAFWPTNDWSVDEVLARVKAAAG